MQKAKAEGEQLGAEKERAKAERREKEVLEKAKAEKIESAKTALSMGLTVDQVAKITGLPVTEVRKLYPFQFANTH